MATNLDLAAINAVLEELYLSEGQLKDQIMRDNPILGMIPKSNEGGGKYRHVQNRFVRPQGRSAAFADALTDRVGSQRVAFDVPWTNNYQICGIDGDVIDDAGGNVKILINHIEEETQGAIDNIKDDMAMNAFRNNGGARGQVLTVTGAGPYVITLKNPEDVAHFEVGMILETSATDGTSGAGDGNALTIDLVDRDAGTLGSAADPEAGGEFAVDDFIFVKGDFGAKCAGLSAWVPDAAPTAGDSFFGVDRSTDVVRLAGVRYDGTGQPIEQAIVNLAARIRRWKKGSMVDCGFVNPIKFAALEIGLEGRKRVETVNGSGEATNIGYKAIMLATPAGDVPIISDPNCQPDRVWLVNKESWMYETVGDMVRLLDEDGNAFLRQTSADGYELRIKSRGNIWCKEPGSNGYATLS